MQLHKVSPTSDHPRDTALASVYGEARFGVFRQISLTLIIFLIGKTFWGTFDSFQWSASQKCWYFFCCFCLCSSFHLLARAAGSCSVGVSSYWLLWLHKHIFYQVYFAPANISVKTLISLLLNSHHVSHSLSSVLVERHHRKMSRKPPPFYPAQ